MCHTAVMAASTNCHQVGLHNEHTQHSLSAISNVVDVSLNIAGFKLQYPVCDCQLIMGRGLIHIVLY